MRFLIFGLVFLMVACKPDASTTAKSSDAPAASASQESKTMPEGANKFSGGETTNPKLKMIDPATGKMPSEDQANPSKREEKKPASNSKSNVNKEGIPDACDLLSTKTIARYVKQPAGQITLNDGSSPLNPKARACFFKWDTSDLPNAGVMVQLQRNPVEEDVPEYFTYLISSKKTEGEKNPSSAEVFMYKDWPGIGDDGAYSTEAGKYVWRVGNEWAFMVAFNTLMDDKSQKRAAEAFAREVMSNISY